MADHQAHLKAVAEVARQLQPYRNLYIDVGNERNVKDSRFVSLDEVAELIATIKEVDLERICTASDGSDISNEGVAPRIAAGLDLLCPHRRRDSKSPAETRDDARRLLKAVEETGRVVPIHYQEPFRRDYSRGWEPTASEFLTDLNGAVQGGAAGWCFHNGSSRHSEDRRPYRSFDMSEQNLFEQLDLEEMDVVKTAASIVEKAQQLSDDVPLSITARTEIWPGSEWAELTPAEAGMDESRLINAQEYSLRGKGSGCIIRSGRKVMEWGDQEKLYDLKSTTKSIGVTALGLAIKDGKISLGDKAVDHHFSFGVPPESNTDTGWLDDITIYHLATQTAGFDKPGGYEALMFKPGTKWAYSDGGPNWLAECITLVYGRDLNDVMFERVFTPIGIKTSDLRWRKNAYRADTINGIKRQEFGAGFHANVDALARIGYLYLRKGKWNGQEIIPESFVDMAGTPKPDVVGLPAVNDPRKTFAGASDHYGLLWWNNADGALKNVPRDAYWSWGLYDSFIIVIPSLDIVVARAGDTIPGERSPSGYRILEPFLKPIAESVQR